MKKTLLLAVGLGLVGAGLLTGCSEKKEAASTPPEVASTNSAPAAPSTNAPAAPAQ